jgi:hypothetical protein
MSSTQSAFRWADFEDALQCAAAVPCHADVIATRNFATAADPRFPPETLTVLAALRDKPKRSNDSRLSKSDCETYGSPSSCMKRFLTLFLLKV